MIGPPVRGSLIAANVVKFALKTAGSYHLLFRPSLIPSVRTAPDQIGMQGLPQLIINTNDVGGPLDDGDINHHISTGCSDADQALRSKRYTSDFKVVSWARRLRSRLRQRFRCWDRYVAVRVNELSHSTCNVASEC